MFMFRLTLLPELWVWSDGVALRASSTASSSLQTHTFGGKPVHDFLLPFTHWRSQNYTKWNNISNPRKISIEPIFSVDSWWERAAGRCRRRPKPQLHFIDNSFSLICRTSLKMGHWHISSRKPEKQKTTGRVLKIWLKGINFAPWQLKEWNRCVAKSHSHR